MPAITNSKPQINEVTPLIQNPSQRNIEDTIKPALKNLGLNLTIAPVSGISAATFQYVISQETQSSMQFAVGVASAFTAKSLNKFIFSFLDPDQYEDASIVVKIIEGTLSVVLPNVAMLGVRALMHPVLPLDENLQMTGIFTALMAATECARKLAEYATKAPEKKEANGEAANLWVNFFGSLVAGLGKGLADQRVGEFLKKFAISSYGFGVGTLTQTLGPQVLGAVGSKAKRSVTLFKDWWYVSGSSVERVDSGSIEPISTIV